MDETQLPLDNEPTKEAPTTQKMIRCRRFIAEAEAKGGAAVPPRYKSNTPKEELLLEHVREFEEQFVMVYGNRFLFLCPPNEYGIPKFLPTTLRPTHLHFKELYEYKTCSQFLADYFNYEELDPPDKYPTICPATASVVKWQAGDCFDLAMAACSLLLGVGYDAYCVSGFAPRFITTRNESRSTAPQFDHEKVVEETKEETDDEKFVIPKKPPLRSEYLAAKAVAEAEEELRMQVEELRSDSEDDPSSDEDKFENRRIHCWVLVRKGSREVPEDFYIEVTTGRIYNVDRCPYLRIDLIWNHRNLWVNMQVCAASQVNLELYNSCCFEYVMLDTDTAVQTPSADGDGGDAPAEEKASTGQILDMPPSWSERIEVTREAFHERCYKGEKTIFYKKCKVEQYAPYTQDDGLVERMTVYKDVRRLKPLEIRENFRHRRDKLTERKRKPMQNETIEQFDPSRAASAPNQPGGALKEFHEVGATSRELLFYNSRLDGLVRYMENIGRKMMFYMEDRDDRLTYLSVTLIPAPARNGSKNGHGGKDLPTFEVESMGKLDIRKMTQKYRRNQELPPDEDIYKICFMLADQEIRVDYHREPGRLTYKTITYRKEGGSVLRAVSKGAAQPIPAEQSKLLSMDKSCRELFAEFHGRINIELLNRRKEENSIRAARSVHNGTGTKRDLSTISSSREEVLEPSVYDLARERAKEDALRQGEEEEKEEEQASKVDILAPYLVDFQSRQSGPVQLDSLQATFVAQKCRKDFRRRLESRADIIQRRLEEEQDSLRKRRSQMQRRGDNVEKDELEFEKYQSNAMFRIQILEQRLARHEMQAIEKFQALEKMLAEDPRLAAMYQKAPVADGGRGGEGERDRTQEKGNKK